MPVPRNDLGRHGLGAQTEATKDAFLDRGSEMRRRPDRARELPETDPLARILKTPGLPIGFGVPPQNLESEGDHFRVDAMGSPDHREIPVADGQTA